MVHIPRAFCGCGHEMLVKKNGVVLQVNSCGTIPYYKIHSDEYECPNCFARMYFPAQKEVCQHGMDPETFDKYPHDAVVNLIG